MTELPTMKLHLLVMVAVSVVTMLNTVSGFILSTGKCVAPSPCTCSSNSVDCNDKSLTDVPPFIPTNSFEHVSPVYLNLYNNKLTTVPDHVFKNLSSINTIHFYLRDNNISSIGHNAFAGVENRTNLIDLSYNNLTSLPSALSSINSLRTLIMDRNPLKSLDPSVIFHLSNTLLYKFMFNMDAFQSWPYELRYFNNLQWLTIKRIPFSHIPLNAFDGMKSSLTSLDMSYSQLPRIPSAICHLRNLDSLYFNYNTKLESNYSLFEPCQHKLETISTLSLRGDRLTSLSDILYSFPNVTHLSVDNNQIRFIHTNTIPCHTKITDLSLTSNRLSRIPFAVNKMKYLRNLYLRYNEIVTIEDNDLTNLDNLNWLLISNNPIEYVAPGAFKNNHLLDDLDLKNTKLTAVLEAVLSLPKLISFPFTGNHVKCTCDMAYLKTLNVTKFSTFSGNCENQRNVQIKQYILTSLQGCP